MTSENETTGRSVNARQRPADPNEYVDNVLTAAKVWRDAVKYLRPVTISGIPILSNLEIEAIKALSPKERRDA